MAELAALQRRFYDRVVGGADADGLVASGDLGVYAHMYGARLLDALVADYPKLAAALGDDAFTELAIDYLRAHPPRSFTLRDCGLHLPAWLADHAAPWASELAALERARVEVFDGPDAAPLGRDEVIALGEALPALALRWVPAHEVVAIRHTIDDLWSAIEDDEPHPAPRQEPRTMLVWRRGLDVKHRTLDADEATLAATLATGTTFAALCDQLGGLHGDAAAPRAVELLLRWLAGEAVALWQ